MSRAITQYQSFTEPLDTGTPLAPLTWQPEIPDAQMPPLPGLRAAIQAGSFFFTNATSPYETQRSAPSDSGVIFTGQLQYQAIATPVFPPQAPAPEQPYHQPEIPVLARILTWAFPTLAFTPSHEASEGSALDWRSIAPDWIASREARWAYPSLAFVHSLDSIQAGWRPTHPDWIARRTPQTLPTLFFIPSADSIQAGWWMPASEPVRVPGQPQRPTWFFTPAHEATEGNALDWWARYPDWMPPKKHPEGEFRFSPFPITAPEAPAQPHHQPELPVLRTRVGWALPTLTWTPQHQDHEGRALDWLGRYPERLPRRHVAIAPMTAAPFATATGFEFPRVTAPDPVRARREVLHQSGAAPVTQPQAVTQPFVDVPHLLRAPVALRPAGLTWSGFTPAAPTLPWEPVWTPVWTRHTLREQSLAWQPETPPAPVPDLPLLPSPMPFWGVPRPQPMALYWGVRTPPQPAVQRVVGIVGAVWERSSGSYIATLRDPQGNIVPGSTLQTLKVTLYTVNRDNSISIVNSREHQPCLNMNDVTVYDALQATADGRRFNLRWRFQPGDTTMVDPALAFERHLILWEYTWSGGSGKHEATIVVHNLSPVF